MPDTAAQYLLFISFTFENEFSTFGNKNTLWNIIRHLLLRREWDSNPRYGCPYTRFPGVPVQPLLHLSLNWNGKYIILNHNIKIFLPAWWLINLWILICKFKIVIPERWQSGWMRRSRKPLVTFSGSGVRISLFPQNWISEILFSSTILHEHNVTKSSCLDCNK